DSSLTHATTPSPVVSSCTTSGAEGSRSSLVLQGDGTAVEVQPADDPVPTPPAATASPSPGDPSPVPEAASRAGLTPACSCWRAGPSRLGRGCQRALAAMLARPCNIIRRLKRWAGRKSSQVHPAN
ncbi:UNVERIFIED_CONTAM: hypothetical protein K2H54_052212, partial [Gekko kuhli]